MSLQKKYRMAGLEISSYLTYDPTHPLGRKIYDNLLTSGQVNVGEILLNLWLQ
jgi:hypothetical protein